jgi:signal transduction histidine kinase
VVSGDAFKGSRILIVDDEDVNVALLQRMLSRAGYGRLTTTTDSREVMRLVSEIQPDLILLDLMMPHVDGYEILAQLRDAGGDVYLPVMVLTADVTPLALQRALSSGARDFLTKPFDQTELLLRVHNLLETRHLYLAMQEQMRSLDRLNEEAMQSIVFRDQTLSAISHDLNQPLTALRLTTEGLQQILQTEPGRNPAVGEDIQMVVAATAQMTAMLAELSDLARLQMGRDLVLQRHPFDILAIVRQQAAAIRKSAGRRRIHVNLPDTEVIGNWDEMRLTRVISNLLSNAVRFTPASGEITLTVETTTIEGVPHAQISVADNGVGIPADELPHISERFYRASNVTGKIHGTGLGLASARQIVEQHRGFLDISSEVNKGTTVVVILPLT